VRVDMTIEAESSPGRPMRSDARRNYERLLSEARAAFSEHGADASLEEVARRAGVGIGTLYRHFPTRLALVEAVYRDDVDSLGTLADDVRSLPPWDALVAWLTRFVSYAMTKRVLFAELAESVGKDSDLISHCRVAIREAAESVVVRAQNEGVIRRDVDVLDVMRLVGGMTMAPNPEPKQSERLLGLVLDGLRVGAKS
jgi:AcrR family transcriptional regulator